MLVIGYISGLVEGLLKTQGRMFAIPDEEVLESGTLRWNLFYNGARLTRKDARCGKESSEIPYSHRLNGS